MRRGIINIALFVALLTLGGNVEDAFAAAQDARNFVEQSRNQIITILKSDTDSMDVKEQKLATLFEKTVDIQWMARFSLGRHWQTINSKQKDEYLRLNHALLFQKYLPEIKEIPSNHMILKQAVELGDKEYMVHTQVTATDGDVTNLDYKVHQVADGSYKIFDVISEGISLINTQRLEFSSILNRKDMDYLNFQLGVRSASAQKYLAAMSVAY